MLFYSSLHYECLVIVEIVFEHNFKIPDAEDKVKRSQAKKQPEKTPIQTQTDIQPQGKSQGQLGK